jgi:hypothetical protein
MNTKIFIQASGLIAILAGILNILSALPGQIPDSTLFWIRRIADISALIALIGLFLYLRREINVFGLIAFVVAVTGVLMLIFSFKYEQAISVYALGVILVAIAILRTGSFPIWVPSLWILSALIALPGFLVPNLATILSLLAAIAFGFGFVGVGYYLFLARPA